MALLHTHPFFQPRGVAVGWDALSGEIVNSKRVAFPLISLCRFSSCDRELPGERAVVLEVFCRLFVIVSPQRLRVVV